MRDKDKVFLGIEQSILWGSWLAPLCDMNGHEERTQAAKMQKRADCGNVGLILD
jgi:hypothetical protein